MMKDEETYKRTASRLKGKRRWGSSKGNLVLPKPSKNRTKMSKRKVMDMVLNQDSIGEKLERDYPMYQFKEVEIRYNDWNGLFYIANDPWLAEQITMVKGNSVPLKCRLDERNVGSLWFIAGNRLVKAGLNQNRAGNFEFNGKSLRAYEEFKAKKKELIKEKAQEDQEIRCARRMGMEATMNDAVRIANNTAPSDSKTKNIRKNRKEESITFMESNTIGSRLNTEETPPMIPMNDNEPEVLAEPEPQNNSEIVSFDEALAKIMEKM